MATPVLAPMEVAVQCHERSESSKHKRSTSNVYMMFIDLQNIIANYHRAVLQRHLESAPKPREYPVSGSIANGKLTYFESYIEISGDHGLQPAGVVMA